jgi:hypothetical protein
VSKAELNKTARPQKGHTDNKLQIELGQQLVQKQKLQTQIDSITKQVEVFLYHSKKRIQKKAHKILGTPSQCSRPIRGSCNRR